MLAIGTGNADAEESRLTGATFSITNWPDLQNSLKEDLPSMPPEPKYRHLEEIHGDPPRPKKGTDLFTLSKRQIRTTGNQTKHH
jgi:hypothetical protein